jgi:hypothetical protein
MRTIIAISGCGKKCLGCGFGNYNKRQAALATKKENGIFAVPKIGV